MLIKLFLSLFIAISFAASALRSQAIPNEFPKNEALPKIDVSVIDLAKANELFREFKQNPNIAFKYPIDGCYARATEMAAMAEGQDISMGKVYAEGKLQVKIANKKHPVVQWGWHVAPVVFVEQPDGKTELMVFDPSLFDRPVTVEEWKNVMLYEPTEDGPGVAKGFKPNIKSLYVGPRFQYYPRFWEETKTKWSKGDLAASKQVMREYKQLEAGFVDPDLEMVSPTGQQGARPGQGQQQQNRMVK